MTSPTLGRAATTMGAATALSRAVGFVRVLVVAAVLGTTYLGNTFLAANSMANVLFELLAAGALSAVLVPTFVGLLDSGDDDEARRLARGLLWVALVGLGLVTVVALVCAPLIARLLASGVEDPGIAADQRRLATFLLCFFVPQVLLYAYGTVATAWLYARRRFVVTALAPIANTAVMVGALLVFRAVAGADPGFDLSLGERTLLVVAGTGGVVGFVAVLAFAARRSGLGLRPQRIRKDPALGRLLRLAAWGVLLHANAGILLGATLVFGNSIAGGVVAYQVAFVFFLAPYAILAQPILTTALPELSTRSGPGESDAFAQTVRWGLDRMAVLVIPVSFAMAALALPAMRIVSFGEAGAEGPGLLAAALAALAFGLYPYGALLFVARAYYALGDSRTPALVAIASAFVGVIVMGVATAFIEGTARVAALGAGHSIAYLVGAVALGIGLRGRLGRSIFPRMLPLTVLVSGLLATVAWLVTRRVDPTTRLEAFAWLALLGAAGVAVYATVIRRALHSNAPLEAAS